MDVMDDLWMIYGCFWMVLSFDLFHTGPRAATHTLTSGPVVSHIYNTIMIRESTCNNIISFQLYVYCISFSLPTIPFDHSPLCFSSVFLSVPIDCE